MRSLIPLAALLALAPAASADEGAFFHQAYRLHGQDAAGRPLRGELRLGEQQRPVLQLRIALAGGEALVAHGRAFTSDTALFSRGPTTYRAALHEGAGSPQALALAEPPTGGTGLTLDLVRRAGSVEGRLEWRGRHLRFRGAPEASDEAAVRDVWFSADGAGYLSASPGLFWSVFAAGTQFDLRVAHHGYEAIHNETAATPWSGITARADLLRHRWAMRRRAGQYAEGLWKIVRAPAPLPRAVSGLKLRVRGRFRFGEVAIDQVHLREREVEVEVTSAAGGELRVAGGEVAQVPIARAGSEGLLLYGLEALRLRDGAGAGGPRLEPGARLALRGYFVPESSALAVTAVRAVVQQPTEATHEVVADARGRPRLEPHPAPPTLAAGETVWITRGHGNHGLALQRADGSEVVVPPDAIAYESSAAPGGAHTGMIGALSNPGP